jgi:hypothetical protein
VDDAASPRVALEVLVCPRRAGPRRIVSAPPRRARVGGFSRSPVPSPTRNPASISVTTSVTVPVCPPTRGGPFSHPARPAHSSPCRAGLPRPRVRPPPRGRTACTVDRGPTVRIVDRDGQQVADFVCFRRPDTGEKLWIHNTTGRSTSRPVTRCWRTGARRR